METQITITIKQDGKEATTKKQEVEDANTFEYHAPSITDKEITEEEMEKQAAVSDLADVCEYLEEKDIIAIKIMAQKARKRKERLENGE